jgi:hypothetical protein
MQRGTHVHQIISIFCLCKDKNSAASALDFFFLLLLGLGIVILCIWPELALWLPNKMITR